MIALYSLALLVSAALLFLLEPMVGKYENGSPIASASLGSGVDLALAQLGTPTM